MVLCPRLIWRFALIGEVVAVSSLILTSSASQGQSPRDFQQPIPVDQDPPVSVAEFVIQVTPEASLLIEPEKRRLELTGGGEFPTLEGTAIFLVDTRG